MIAEKKKHINLENQVLDEMLRASYYLYVVPRAPNKYLEIKTRCKPRGF